MKYIIKKIIKCLWTFPPDLYKYKNSFNNLTDREYITQQKNDKNIKCLLDDFF